MITQQEIDAILKGILSGLITTTNLPEAIYDENRIKLNDGVEEGFGSTLKKLTKGTSTFQTLASLKDNVTFFSAAKTFQQVNDMQFLRLDEKGFIRSFSDFKKDAGTVLETYNKEWLETEFNTSISQSQSASQWADIQDNKDVLPLLQYRTAKDERVRNEHTQWDNIIRPVDDPFWDTHYAPNGYNCFVPDTKILTPDGWKGISSINKGDFVIGGSGKSRKVIGLHVNTIKESLVKIESKNGTITCTENHRVLTVKGWKAAGLLNDKDIIIQLFKVSALDNPVSYVDRMNTILGNMKVSFIIKCRRTRAETLNYYIDFRNEYVNPVRRNIITKLGLKSKTSDIIEHDSFAFSWLYFSIYMAFWVLPKKFFSGLGTFFHNIFSPKRSRLFKFFRNNSKRLVSFFSLSKVRVSMFFDIIYHISFHNFALGFSSAFVSNPLRSNSGTTPSRFDFKMNKQSSDGSIVNTPSFTEHSKSEHVSKVETNKSLFNGQPLERFNLLKDFIRYSFFHLKYVSINNITKVQYIGNVHNLSVEKDESYITELGIVHNCRCTIIQLSEGKVSSLKGVPKNSATLFADNVGKTEQVFKETGKDKHPYFEAPQKLKDKNFGLPK